ncbi:MAG: hypothetical protein FWE95_00185 [Planctomycetaceae bacterium]|nr:hypothetical protein [Planctomycetaceae bacterium]
MSVNLPITALRIAGQGLGMAGRGAMGAAQFGGRTLVSPGMIGSMARWTAASMVISSLPNPAARKQAIDKALHEANREAEREYLSLREDMKRGHQLRKRQREFDSTQRILDSHFLANPEERNFERRIAELGKKYDETLQRIEEVALQRQQDMEESHRIMASRRDVGMFTRYGEDIHNFGKGVYNSGVGAVQGAAGLVDLLTFGITNLHGENKDWEKRMSSKEMTMVVPKEWTDKYGRMENTEVHLSDNAGYKIVDGMVKAWGKTAQDLEKAQEEFQKFREGMERNHIDAMQKQAQERMEAQRRHTQMLHAMETSAKAKQLGILDIETDTVIKEAQLDAVLGSRFASPEQKILAKIDKEALAEQTALSLKYNEKRNEMVETGKLLPVKHEDQDAVNAKYRAKHQDNYDQAKAEYDKRFGEDKQKQFQELEARVTQRKLHDTSDGLFGNLEKSALVGGFFKHMNELSLPQKRGITVEVVRNDPEYQQRAAEIEQGYEERFKQSREYKAYETRQDKITAEHAQENTALRNQKEVRTRGDIEGRAIDHQEAVEKAQVSLKFEERKRAVQAAMQLPVRSSLEESYNMVNDELLKQGEVQRLGGKDSDVAKVVDESIKPALEKLDRHYEKLERVLQSGEVRATVQVKV